MIQQLNQLDPEIQQDNSPPEATEMIPSTSEKLLPGPVESSIPLPFVFKDITEIQKRAVITDITSLAENPIFVSATSLLFEKHSNVIHAIP